MGNICSSLTAEGKSYDVKPEIAADENINFNKEATHVEDEANADIACTKAIQLVEENETITKQPKQEETSNQLNAAKLEENSDVKEKSTRSKDERKKHKKSKRSKKRKAPGIKKDNQVVDDRNKDDADITAKKILLNEIVSEMNKLGKQVEQFDGSKLNDAFFTIDQDIQNLMMRCDNVSHGGDTYIKKRRTEIIKNLHELSDLYDEKCADAPTTISDEERKELTKTLSEVGDDLKKLNEDMEAYSASKQKELDDRLLKLFMKANDIDTKMDDDIDSKKKKMIKDIQQSMTVLAEKFNATTKNKSAINNQSIIKAEITEHKNLASEEIKDNKDIKEENKNENKTQLEEVAIENKTILAENVIETKSLSEENIKTNKTVTEEDINNENEQEKENHKLIDAIDSDVKTLNEQLQKFDGSKLDDAYYSIDQDIQSLMIRCDNISHGGAADIKKRRTQILKELNALSDTYDEKCSAAPATISEDERNELTKTLNKISEDLADLHKDLETYNITQQREFDDRLLKLFERTNQIDSKMDDDIGSQKKKTIKEVQRSMRVLAEKYNASAKEESLISRREEDEVLALLDRNIDNKTETGIEEAEPDAKGLVINKTLTMDKTEEKEIQLRPNSNNNITEVTEKMESAKENMDSSIKSQSNQKTDFNEERNEDTKSIKHQMVKENEENMSENSLKSLEARKAELLLANDPTLAGVEIRGKVLKPVTKSMPTSEANKSEEKDKNLNRSTVNNGRAKSISDLMQVFQKQ